MTEKTNLNAKINRWDWTADVVDIAQPFSLIFHCNLNSMEHPSSEYLKNSILSALQKCPKIICTNLFEDMGSVWKEFTITPALNGITRYPNYCLRIDGICTYTAYPYNIIN